MSQLTPEQIEAQALERRLAEEQAAALVAVRMLIDTLGLPDGADEQDIAAALVERDLTSDEVMDWLVLCEYEPGCFEAEMSYQLGQADKRRRGKRAVLLAAAGAVGAIALGIYALRGR